MRLILVGMVLIPFGLVLGSLQKTSITAEKYLEQHLAFALAISLILAMAVPSLVIQWLIGKRIVKIREFCSLVKQGKYREMLKLPNELSGGQDEEELTLLMRDMNWMARQIDIRQQAMLESNIRIEEQKRALMAVNDQLLKVQAKKQQQAEELAELCQRMKTMAMTDPLTEIANRRCFFDALQNEVQQGVCDGSLISMLIVDVDNFKKINDSYGHQVGDRVLQQLAKIIGEVTRKDDLLARIGGEEFGLLMSGVDLQNAIATAQRIRNRVAESDIPVTNGLLKTTVSIGVCTMLTCPYVPDYEKLYLYADQALYYSKNNGRNSVSVYNADCGSISIMN